MYKSRSQSSKQHLCSMIMSEINHQETCRVFSLFLYSVLQCSLIFCLKKEDEGKPKRGGSEVSRVYSLLTTINIENKETINKLIIEAVGPVG